MTGWIRVSEHLPDTGKKVIASFTNSHGKRRTICAHYIARWTTPSDNFSDHELNHEYHEEKDEYFLCEGWYENIENWGDFSSVSVSEGDISHWMPLPPCPDD